MKVIAVIVLLCVEVNTVPLESPHNHAKEPQWTLIPYKDWTLHLVDVNAEEFEPEIIFNPQQDVVFRLFTYTDSNRVVELDNVASLTGSSFNPSYPTRFIIHGWSADGNSSININIRKAYLSRDNYNVFVVDWGIIASYNYIAASRRVESVGKTVARFIIFLNQQTGMTLGSITIVGHSLGAHVAGFAGKNVVKGRIGVIVGLDAAYPFYYSAKPHEMLHISDAAYVETIHTNMGLLGQSLPIGHASFYPNYGRYQPGCGSDFTDSCSHSRSYEYYAESITTSHGFWAQKCRSHEDIIKENCQIIGNDALMGGEPSSKKLKGVFLLHTNSSSPYALGK